MILLTEKKPGSGSNLFMMQKIHDINISWWFHEDVSSKCAYFDSGWNEKKNDVWSGSGKICLDPDTSGQKIFGVVLFKSLTIFMLCEHFIPLVFY